MESYRDKYKNTLPYPDRDDYKTIHIYSNGKCLFTGKLSDYKKQAGPDGVQEIVEDKEAYNAALKVYRQEDQRLYAAFREEVLEENGILNHPKADKVFSMAWEDGHSSGYDEVACYVDKYTDLVRD